MPFHLEAEGLSAPVEEVGAASELLARVEAGGVLAVVLGPGVDRPVRIAQRVRALDETMSVLILASLERLERLSRSTDAAPFVGERVICRAAEDPRGIVSALEEAVARPRLTPKKIGDRMTPVTMSTMRYLDRILEHGTSGVMVCDSDGVIVSLNDRAGEMLGSGEHDALGAPLKNFFKSEQLREIAAVNEGPRVMELAHPDGTTRSLELRGASVTDGAEHVAFVLLLEDLTERRKDEAKLASAYEDLKRMHALQVNLLSMVSHDIRAPLGVVVGAINELSSKDVGQLNKDQEFLIVLIRRSVERLTRLASNLVLLSRMESGKVDLVRRKTDVRPLAKQVCDNTQRIDASANVTVQLEVPDAPLEANVDAERITQVLSNLLSNAVRFAKNSVKVRLWPEGEELVIEVTDDGQGIPENAIGSIFERFSRVEAPKSGTGLGLAIVRAIVETHGGTARAENLKTPEGKPQGARLTVRVPRYAE
jgi:NtrC-family two-component system sensor histidine kinase KinB